MFAPVHGQIGDYGLNICITLYDVGQHLTSKTTTNATLMEANCKSGLEVKKKTAAAADN